MNHATDQLSALKEGKKKKKSSSTYYTKTTLLQLSYMPELAKFCGNIK